MSRQEKEAKEATARTLAFGFPVVQDKKWEMKPTRCAQTCFISDPFSALHNRQRPSGFHVNSNFKSEGNFNFNFNFNFKSNGNFNDKI